MRRVIAAVGATLTASALALSFTAASASAATPQTTQANAALRYLYGQIGTLGDVGGSLGTTEDTVISVADNGYDPATLKSSSGATAYDYLHGNESTITTAGAAAKYILAWIAAGKPSAIDASSLLTKLNTPTGSGGYRTSKGTFHNADPTVETANAYSQSLAVLADVAAGHSLPANATGWLTCAQRTGGGFGYVIDDLAATPPSFCGDTTSDTNDTAIILQALGAAGVTTADSTAKTYLHSAQRSDGGFGFGTTDPSDPDSDATVIQGLVAIGEDPTGSAWTVSGGNPLSNLETFADPQGSGGYVYPGNPGPNVITTAGIPQALALKPYGATTAVVAGTSPPPVVTPAATAAPTATPSGVPVPATGAAAGAGEGGLVLTLLGLGAATVGGAAWVGRRTRVPS